MNINLDSFGVVLEATFLSQADGEQLEGLVNCLSDAKEELLSFKWALGIREAYVGLIVPGIMTVALFHIERDRDDVDDFIWMIVGDIPSLYLTVDTCRDVAGAIDGYIGAMEEWISAVRRGLPVDDVVPVDAAPTLQNAADLESRLQFIDNEILAPLLRT